MGNTTEQKVTNILELKSLFKDVEAIFNSVQSEYELSKEEVLILLTLWDKGSMTLKEMDDHVPVKSYKRTRTYNDLVEKSWVTKERPKNDERTVIIHFNASMKKEKEQLLDYIIKEAQERKEKMQSSLNSILNLS